MKKKSSEPRAARSAGTIRLPDGTASASRRTSVRMQKSKMYDNLQIRCASLGFAALLPPGLLAVRPFQGREAIKKVIVT